jgi:hypothetical protein
MEKIFHRGSRCYGISIDNTRLMFICVPFSNNLELNSIIQRINNKVKKALYSIKGFLKIPHIPIPYKRMLFSVIVIEQFSYYAPLLGS